MVSWVIPVEFLVPDAIVVAPSSNHEEESIDEPEEEEDHCDQSPAH